MCAKHLLHKMNKMCQISMSNTRKNQRSRNFCHHFKGPIAVIVCCFSTVMTYRRAWSTLKKSANLSFLTEIKFLKLLGRITTLVLCRQSPLNLHQFCLARDSKYGLVGTDGTSSDGILHRSDCTWLCCLLCQ